MCPLEVIKAHMGLFLFIETMPDCLFSALLFMFSGILLLKDACLPFIFYVFRLAKFFCFSVVSGYTLGCSIQAVHKTGPSPFCALHSKPCYFPWLCAWQVPDQENEVGHQLKRQRGAYTCIYLKYLYPTLFPLFQGN